MAFFRRAPVRLLAATGAATAAAAYRAPAGQAPTASPDVLPLEAKYEQVDLALEGDSDCPVCKALKRTPCWQPFLWFHKCSEYHTSRGEEIVGPCTRYALALNDCLGANAHSLPPEIANQRWQQKSQPKPK